jgi:uncharacterized protein YndB with AHSA1/START domain
VTIAVHNSFTLERRYPVPPAKVFRALSDPARKRRWFAEHTGFTIDSYTLDFREGGFERTRFRPSGGPPMTNDCVYLEIVREERVVFAYAMTIDGKPLSSSLGVMELVPEPGATLLRYTEHTAYTDGTDGSASRREGTEELFERLAHEIATHD